MDNKKIEKLCELMKKHDLSELEVEEDGKRVRLAKPTGDVATMVAAPAASIAAPPPAVAAAPASAESSPAPEAAGEKILSPFVGVFYECPSPGTPPFVSVGQRVKKGDTLCIIEAMKIMNEIEAERDCVIKEQLVQNEGPVEFNQPLFIIE